MPEMSTEDRFAGVLDNLKTVLQNPYWKLPSLIKGIQINDAIKALSNIFKPPKNVPKFPSVPIQKIDINKGKSPRVVKFSRLPELPTVNTQY